MNRESFEYRKSGIMHNLMWKMVSKHPVVSALSFLYVLNWLYCYLSCGTCRSRARMDGKTVLITGGTSGIGKATAIDLARRGARIIIACRNLTKGQRVRDKIFELTGNSDVEVKLLDVSLMASVRDFAADVNTMEARLDVLVLNAGTVDSFKKKTSEGLSLIWATNHFGHFLLTLLLTDLLKKTTNSRVVAVSSVAHYRGVIDFDRINDEKSSFDVYCNTKLANILFANELAKRLREYGVTANSLHPGAIHTPIWNKNPSWIHVALILLKPFFKSEEQGAQTTIHLCVSEELEGVTGKYFSDCKERTPSKTSMDADLAKRFWNFCERTTQVGQ